MPATALKTAESLYSNMDASLRTIGYDVPSLINEIDFKTVGLVAGAVILGLFIFQILTQWLGGQALDEYSSYSTYGRSLAVGAARAWDQREQALEGSRGGRSMDSVTRVLDSLSHAVLKYEKENPRNTTSKPSARQSKILN